MKKILFFASIALFTLSCSSVKVYSDKDATVDFTQYKTLEYYGWADNSDRILNDLDKDELKRLLEQSSGVEALSLLKVTVTSLLHFT